MEQFRVGQPNARLDWLSSISPGCEHGADGRWKLTRAALVLRYYLDLSEAEVARQLGVPAGTVKSLVHRGLARLRERLGTEYAGERLTSNTEAEA
jgi:hypothetical protein